VENGPILSECGQQSTVRIPRKEKGKWEERNGRSKLISQMRDIPKISEQFSKNRILCLKKLQTVQSLCFGSSSKWIITVSGA
jgi:hypothetical protein